MSTQQFDDAFELWMRNHRYTDNPQVIAKIAQRVHENLDRLGGLVSPSSFERAYLELVSEKAIKSFRGAVDQFVAAQTPTIEQEILDYIENPRTSARDMARRYQSDPVFRKQYDLWERSKVQKQEQQPADTLTAEQYHRIPAATIAAKYQRDPEFRAQVDALIKAGRI